MYKIETSSSDYKKFIEGNKYYVDKTLLIEELINLGEVVLITRPRRFGKTLNLSMLDYYFNIEKDNFYLFKGKKILLKNRVLFEQYLNKYPVIFLTLKGIEGNTFEEIYSSFKTTVSNLYSKHKYLKDKLDIYDTEIFNKMLSKNGDFSEYKNSLYKLSEFMYKYYSKKVIILLDEYDSMLNSLKTDEMYEDVINLLRGLIGDAFKGNDYLEKGVMTGILKIAKESLFSGANNIITRTILDDDFNDKFGFTEEETTKLLNDFSIQDKALDVKDWYNGYSFGRLNKVVMYNPYSIANYVQEKVLRNYWINTGSNEIIKNLLLNSSSDIKKNLDTLLKKESINVKLKENIVISNLKNKDYLWSLLLFSGYLKPIKETDYNQYNLELVNKEVISSMNEIIEEYFIETVESDKILKAIKECDIETFGEELSNILLTNVNSKNLINENSYHTFLLGISSVLRRDYIVKSEESSGKGRYDISIESKDKKQGYIVEIKNSKNEKEDLKKLSETALKQIEKNIYYTYLKMRGIESIYIVGIAFYKKDFVISYKIVQ